MLTSKQSVQCPYYNCDRLEVSEPQNDFLLYKPGLRATGVVKTCQLINTANKVELRSSSRYSEHYFQTKDFSMFFHPKVTNYGGIFAKP